MRGHAIIVLSVLAWLFNVRDAEANLNILVDKATQRMLVIQDGYIRYMWPVSTGRDNMQTPNGVYSPQRMERNWFSSAYYDSPMPFSIFFYHGYAIHGSYAIDRLGGPASHGCVRLHPHHAAILFDLVQQEGPERTTIEITDEGRPPQPATAGREISPTGGTPAPRESLASRESLAPGEIGPPGEVAASREVAAPQEGPPSREIFPPREIPPPKGAIPSAPKIARYSEGGDLPETPPPLRSNPPMIAKGISSLRLATSPHRALAYAKPSANVPRNPGGAGGTDRPGGIPRSPNESADSRPKTRAIEGSKVAEGSPPLTAQPATQPVPSAPSFKQLPASCWSGGASRWQWWASNRGNSCK
jgi:hypothetical protein